MEISHQQKIKDAANLIREGNTKGARALLISVLREDEENAQAWYALSFAVPVQEKQIEALQQALRIQPDNQKALDRLNKLGGKLIQEASQGQPASEKLPDDTWEQIPPFTAAKPQIPDDDLLNSRLFGESEKQADSAIAEDEVEQLTDQDILRSLKESLGVDALHQVPIDPDSVLPEEIDSRKSKIPPKVFGIKSSYLMIGILIVIVSVLGILGLSPKIRQALFGGQPTALVEAGDGARNDPTELPPTATLMPQSTPTTIPTPSPTPVLFTLSYLGGISEETQDEFDALQESISSFFGYSPNSPIESFSISEPQLQALIWDLAKVESFQAQVSDTHRLYQYLEIASPADDFEAFFQNAWVDPNGTIVVPDKPTIALTGFGLSSYQDFSYGQAVVQLLRRDQFAQSPLFSRTFPCYAPTQECEVWNAIVKGEAIYTARAWAAENLDADQFAAILSANQKNFFTPIVPSPTRLMETVRLFSVEKGMALAESVYKRGGWAGVAGLYTNPPITTEQLLHPDKYLASETPGEILSPELSEILPSDATLEFDLALGEWKTYLMLAYQLVPVADVTLEAAEAAAAGWNGDRMQIYLLEDQQNLIIGHWSWDTPQDQLEFESIMLKITERQVGGLETDILGEICNQSNLEVSCLIKLNGETLWVLAPDIETASDVLALYLPDGVD